MYPFPFLLCVWHSQRTRVQITEKHGKKRCWYHFNIMVFVCVFCWVNLSCAFLSRWMNERTHSGFVSPLWTSLVDEKRTKNACTHTHILRTRWIREEGKMKFKKISNTREPCLWASVDLYTDKVLHPNQHDVLPRTVIFCCCLSEIVNPFYLIRQKMSRCYASFDAFCWRSSSLSTDFVFWTNFFSIFLYAPVFHLLLFFKCIK